MNGTPQDASGNNNHLLVTNCTPGFDGYGNPASAYDFDPNMRSSLKVLDGPATDLTTAFSWAGCVKFGRIGSARETMAQKSDGVSDANAMFEFGTNGNFGVRYSVTSGILPGSSYGSFNAGPVLTNEVWYHAALVYNGTTRQVDYYLNGDLQDSTFGVPASLNNSVFPLEFGSNSGGTVTGDGYLKGSMDEVWWFNRPLAASEVAILASCGCGVAFVPCNVSSCTLVPPAPYTFTRITGKPRVETRTFESCGGSAKMVIESTGVGSAIVKLNGSAVSGTRKFNSQSTREEILVTLAQGSNTLEVELRGAPGQRLTVSFSAAD